MQTAYNNDKYTYAGFFIRLAAFVLDILIVNVLLLLFKIPVWCVKLALGDTFLFSPVLFSYNIFDILYYLIQTAYFVLATYYCGATLGKYLMKIKVVSTDEQPLTFMSVLIRETVGRYLSAIILYIGYMLAGWSEEKQGLHDRIADTYVVYRNMGEQKKQPRVQRTGTAEQSASASMQGTVVQSVAVPMQGAVTQSTNVPMQENMVQSTNAPRQENMMQSTNAPMQENVMQSTNVPMQENMMQSTNVPVQGTATQSTRVLTDETVVQVTERQDF